MSRFGRTEKTIFFIAMTVFAMMSYFLYDDTLLFPSSGPQTQAPIGTVSSSLNDVRKKNYDNFSWLPASRKDQLFENDSIFTGERSEALLQLNEGASIRLQPNSLVTLNLKDSQMMLDLRYGNLKGEIKSGTSITVRSGDEEFLLENKDGNPASSEVEFTKDHSGNVEVKLLSGSATFINKKTQTRASLSKEKPLVVSKNGQVQQVIKPELVMTTADKLALVRETPDAPLSLRWQSKGKIDQFEVEISPKEDFSVITASQKTTDQQVEIRNLIEPGNYFWRLKGLDGQGQVLTISKSQQLSISLPPVALAPPPPPPPSVAKAPPIKIRPDTPVLVTKKVTFKVPSSQERSLASAPSPEIKWKTVPQVKSYQLQISKDGSFTEVEKYDIAQNSASWAQYQPGAFHYRVIARGINGLTSEPSEVGTMNIHVGEITLSPLKPITIIGKIPTPVEMPVTWTEIPFAKTYLVQLDKDPGFAQPHQMEYPSPGGKLTIHKPGLYKVRVQALDRDNKPLNAFSNTEEALYIFRSPLDSPVLTEPFNQASIFLQTEMEPFIWLEWKDVAGSISYSVEISDKPDFSRILISKTLAKTRYLVKDRVPLGKIYWRVRANAKNEQETSLWAEKREFTLYHQKNETFVK